MAKPAAAPVKHTVILSFVKEKETKGAVRYQEQDVPTGQEPVIGALYTRKARGVTADRLKITIESV